MAWSSASTTSDGRPDRQLVGARYCCIEQAESLDSQLECHVAWVHKHRPLCWPRAIKGRFSCLRSVRFAVYAKPYLTYELQLDHLVERGLACADRRAALGLLRAVGYYRFSAYVYPFREFLPDDHPRDSSVHYRSERIRTDVGIDDVAALWRFDRKLRLSCLDAIETVEIGVRTAVAHVLGRRDPFGHLHVASLDEVACRAPSRRTDNTGRPRHADTFDEWRSKYEALQGGAKNEDYVVHNLAKYGDPLPIWIAIEFLDLGALTKLFSLLDRRDQNEVADSVGVHGGRLLAAWLRDINYLRNLCAHHSRLWNRTVTYASRKFQPNQVGEPLRHAADHEPRTKIYVYIAVLGYLASKIDPNQRWAESSLRTQVRKFPTGRGLSPEQDMGFPVDWADLPLWTMKT